MRDGPLPKRGCGSGFSAPELAVCGVRAGLASGELLDRFEEAVRLCRCLSLGGRRRTGRLVWSGLGERFGSPPARFFAEAGEFLFVEAFVVFLEDLLSPGQILLLDEYVASAAERNSRASGTSHTGDACVGQASEENTLLDWTVGRGEDLEHLREGSPKLSPAMAAHSRPRGGVPSAA